MSMDKLKAGEFFPTAKEGEELPEYSAKLLKWAEKDLWYRISKRINFLLDFNNNGFHEIIKEGNVAGDDGNWRISISTGDWIIQERVSGAWVDATKTDATTT